ncbi:MAG: cytochrome P450, partial [Novosphingobium sp.]|nr:cytochrome P450 [Novosphingobium sp.]
MTMAATKPEYRSSPIASEVIDDWLLRNPQTIPPPTSRFDVGRMELFNEDRWQAVFREMRAEAPVNKVTGTIHGDYWNICTHKGVQHVEALPELFSSSFRHGGVSMIQPPENVAHNYSLPMFIAMDRPDHTVRRRTVAPAFTPTQVARLAEEVRDRTGKLLDSLPLGETFDWVETVSVDLTTSMLAILFDFPREDQKLLTFWSDWVTAIEAGQIPEVANGRAQASQEMAEY